MNPKLADLVSDILDVPAAELTPQMRREEHPSWDSFNHLRLMTAIEESFGVQFAMDEIERIETLEQLNAALESHLQQA